MNHQMVDVKSIEWCVCVCEGIEGHASTVNNIARPVAPGIAESRS